MVDKPHFRFLFRFRDLIAETIGEHQRVIDSHRYCWWGWWKRPKEADHDSIWKQIAEKLGSEHPVFIGLFDSGKNNRVYVARVLEILKPGGQTLADEELTRVPEYYRKSPFSRAWLKLSSIREWDEPFFGHFSFAKPPLLPGIPESKRRHLVGKVIMDAGELRSMDTTIWEIRPREKEDREEHFLAASFSFSEPISPSAFQVEGNTILHLTDLHFATAPHREEHYWGYADEQGAPITMAEQVAHAVRKSGACIGLMVVTGDLTFKASREEFGAAFHALNHLRGLLGLSPDQVVIVPGNHDIAWSAEAPGSFIYAGDEQMRAYRTFFEEFFGFEPNEHLSMGRRFLLPSGCVVEICALNSSSLAQNDQHLPGMGWVHTGAFPKVSGSLGWNNRHAGYGLRLLALHHHLTPPENYHEPEEFKTGFGMAADATGILRQAARNGVHLALHGHRHLPFIWRARVYNLPNEPGDWDLGPVSILGGGSVGSSSVRDGNYFNLITVHGNCLEAVLFKSTHRAAFTAVNRFTTQLALVEGHMTMGLWEKQSLDPNP